MVIDFLNLFMNLFLVHVTLAKVELSKLVHSRGQAEKEFRVEVDAIGHVRHKNLVRLLGYCIEGTHRYCFLLHCVLV
jgi:hypothetical protein